jgi:hypothetical protein
MPQSLSAHYVCYTSRQGKGSQIGYTVTGKGGVLIGDLILSVGSASAALKQSAESQEDFKCAVVVTDEQGNRVSASDLENLADAETLTGAVASDLLPEYQLYFLTLAGSVVRREEFKLPNDKDALAHAKQFVDGLALEL